MPLPTKDEAQVLLQRHVQLHDFEAKQLLFEQEDLSGYLQVRSLDPRRNRECFYEVYICAVNLFEPYLFIAMRELFDKNLKVEIGVIQQQFLKQLDQSKLTLERILAQKAIPLAARQRYQRELSLTYLNQDLLHCKGNKLNQIAVRHIRFRLGQLVESFPLSAQFQCVPPDTSLLDAQIINDYKRIAAIVSFILYESREDSVGACQLGQVEHRLWKAITFTFLLRTPQVFETDDTTKQLWRQCRLNSSKLGPYEIVQSDTQIVLSVFVNMEELSPQIRQRAPTDLKLQTPEKRSKVQGFRSRLRNLYEQEQIEEEAPQIQSSERFHRQKLKDCYINQQYSFLEQLNQTYNQPYIPPHDQTPNELLSVSQNKSPNRLASRTQGYQSASE